MIPVIRINYFVEGYMFGIANAFDVSIHYLLNPKSK